MKYSENDFFQFTNELVKQEGKILKIKIKKSFHDEIIEDRTGIDYMTYRNYIDKYGVGIEFIPEESVNNYLIIKKLGLREVNGNTDTEKKEMVNHPKHYGGDTTYECIKVLKAWNTEEEFLGFCKDNAIKYLCRSGKKDEEKQEWQKALWYIQEGIKYLEEKNQP